jgi:hypothetical protein
VDGAEAVDDLADGGVGFDGLDAGGDDVPAGAGGVFELVEGALDFVC